MSTPQSFINIISDLPIDNRYDHTLYFETIQDQNEFFNQRVVKVFAGYTYLRRNWSIKVEADMSTARRWTYLYFINLPDTKRYYYFITKVEYVNETTVMLHLEMDVIQTYFFDFNMGECFVERCHTVSDEIGEHTIDEGLETGELITTHDYFYSLSDLCVLILSAVDGDGHSAFAKIYDGNFSGLAIYAVDLSDYQRLGLWLDNLSNEGAIDAVVNMWVYPKDLVKISGTWEDGVLLHTVVGGSKPDQFMVSNVRASAFPDRNGESYYPSNKKLKTYPYTFLYVTNNNGGSAIYPFERFNTSLIKFKMFGALSPDSGVKIAPLNYKGQEVNYDEALALDAFPTCAWDSDTYKVWLAQNQHTQNLTSVQAKINAATGAAQAVASGLTLNLGGAVGGLQQTVNAAFQIQSLMAQQKDMAVQPPQARGSYSANINLANDMQGFTFMTKAITAEYARSIDDYFTRYGYKVNCIMRPDLCTREHFTYIKTVGCSVMGQIGYEDRVKINEIFDHGITLWRDHILFGYYPSQNRPLKDLEE